MVEGAGYIAGESMRNDTKQTIEPDRLCYRSLVNECGPIGAEHEPSAIYIVTEREPEAGLVVESDVDGWQAATTTLKF